MAANGVYGMSAVMALTAQNTTGVQGIMEVTPEFAGQQIDSIFTDIRPDAVKIGMLSSGEIIHVVAEKLKEYQAEHIVLDPVMVSTSGHRLIQKDAEQSLKKELFPLAELITPNIPEAEVLSGRKIKNAQDMESAAEKIVEEYGCAVLLKGGHRINDANDFLCTGEKKSGSVVSGWKIPIPTEPVVLFPVRSPRILQKVQEWKRRCRRQKNI